METFVSHTLEDLVLTRYGASGLDWSPYVAAALEDADPLSEEV
jgi:hypothetical protein